MKHKHTSWSFTKLELISFQRCSIVPHCAPFSFINFNVCIPYLLICQILAATFCHFGRYFNLHEQPCVPWHVLISHVISNFPFIFFLFIFPFFANFALAAQCAVVEHISYNQNIVGLNPARCWTFYHSILSSLHSQHKWFS